MQHYKKIIAKNKSNVTRKRKKGKWLFHAMKVNPILHGLFDGCQIHEGRGGVKTKIYPPLIKIRNTHPNEMELCPDQKYH